LTELATDFDLEELEKVITDPTSAIWPSSPSRRAQRAEFGACDDGIIDYLNDPEAAMLQMQLRLLDLVACLNWR